MKSYLYLSLLPESLIASMLPPEEFGMYLATGTAKQPHGQAMFLQIREDFQSSVFNLKEAYAKCVRRPDGTPKHSVYLAIYRVLEHIPLDAVESLWLITASGRCLEIKPTAPTQKFEGKYHLYREITPVHPLIASEMDPLAFTKFITDTTHSISVPKIFFAEMDINGMADDPITGKADNLPYKNVEHIRHCLYEVSSKKTKTVDRVAEQIIPFRCIKPGSGLFLGNQEKVIFYPFPSKAELEGKYNAWWRSA